MNGALLKISIGELQRLLFQVPNSTLTVWSHSGDPLAVDDLLVFRKAFGINQVVYDVPVCVSSDDGETANVTLSLSLQDEIIVPFRNEVFSRRDDH